MEYVPGGDLGKFIADEGVFDESMAKVMARQLLSALGYLHANNITHRDVKPDNILINSVQPLELKLTDFGLSKMVDSEQTFLRTFCGTLLYCAPEVYNEYAEYDDNGNRTRGKKVRRLPGQRYSHAIDIWSLGGVLFYAMTGSPPYPVKGSISYSELLNKIMTTRLNIAPLQRHGTSEEGIEFLCRMLQRRPEYRATVVELDGHPWIGGQGSTIEASQSYDEITDDEDLIGNLAEFQQPQGYDEDRVSDSMGEESEKENYTFGHGTQPPRLFGEIGVSAIGSSGAIPEDFLNLPPGESSLSGDDVRSHEIDEEGESDDSATPRARSRRTYRQNAASIAQQQSTDQLQSLVEDVASQSLGGDETFIKQQPPSSRYSMQSTEFNTSKRKPSSHDASDEFEENTPPGKPFLKRLKSEGTMDSLTDCILDEYKLLATMPQIRRLGSGRQIDDPVDKVSFWEQDRRTWHLNYPEMTQLQHDAFSQAARDRNEEFAPGRSPLWDLAMKYFPPSSRNGAEGQHRPSYARAGLRRDDRQVADDAMEFPPTAVPVDDDSIPDTMAPPDTQIVVPIHEDSNSARAVGMLESHSKSCIEGISLPITDSLISFGRGPENTVVFEPKTESRVPKYAMKIMLWKDGDGYDPSKDPAKVPHPWLRDNAGDSDSYSFWISTKATLGIRINEYFLASSDSKNPSSPACHWTQIYDGDTLVIWSGSELMKQSAITFRCFWGASSKLRGEDKTLKLASPALAQKLDSACQRTERRIKDVVEKRNRESEALSDQKERLKFVDREREKSRIFEMKRQEAVSYLFGRQNQSSSRRASPAIAPATTARTSRLQPGIIPRISPDSDAGLSAH